MTQIERQVYLKVIFSLVKQDSKGNFYITKDEYNSLFIPDTYKEEFAEMLVENEVEIREPVITKRKRKAKSFEDGERQQLMKSYRKITVIEDRLAQDLGRYPTTMEIARETGIPVRTVESIKAQAESYNNFIGHKELSEVIGTDVNASIIGQDEYADDVYAELYRKEIKDIVLDALKGFDEKLIEMFKYHYGLEDGDYHNFTETAAKFGMTRTLAASRIAVMNTRARVALSRMFENEEAIKTLYDIDVASQHKRI